MQEIALGVAAAEPVSLGRQRGEQRDRVGVVAAAERADRPPPMQYLAQWRMQLGARLLVETRSTVATVAQEVGYESEAAFARAFKRLVGTPPAAWRRNGETAT